MAFILQLFFIFQLYLNVELKNILKQKGVSVITYTVLNELKAEEFIHYLNFEYNNDITYEEIIESLKNKKNTQIHVNQPIQNLTHTISNNVMHRAKFVNNFMRQLNNICNSNNLSILLKSYIFTSMGAPITVSTSLLYSSHFIGYIDKNKLSVQKSRYSEQKEYDLEHLLLRDLRKKKLENIEKSKTS